MQEQEIWKAVVGYEGLYEVSNLGKVKNKKTGRLKTPTPNSNGYLVVGLSKNGELKNFRVHRLVAEAFIPNPQGLETVNHKDHNRQNNSVDNLEWCSRGDNTREASSKKVLCVETNTVFNSLTEACKWCNGSISNISDCCQGRRKTHKKYHWKYVTEGAR